MVDTIYVNGYENFSKAIKEFNKSEDQINVYFTGDKNEQGVSWCPDCNNALPYVETAIKNFAKKGSIFAVVYVGERAFWKDMTNPFRKDPNSKLSVIPTLIRWNSVLRLEGEQLEKPDLLEMFFTEDE